eukprot:Amastigsp_a342931_276.p2 type:complete len:126 gc:universal Amastigsp_a342931_276:582-205(-)
MPQRRCILFTCGSSSSSTSTSTSGTRKRLTSSRRKPPQGPKTRRSRRERGGPSAPHGKPSDARFDALADLEPERLTQRAILRHIMRATTQDSQREPVPSASRALLITAECGRAQTITCPHDQAPE